MGKEDDTRQPIPPNSVNSDFRLIDLKKRREKEAALLEEIGAELTLKTFISNSKDPEKGLVLRKGIFINLGVEQYIECTRLRRLTFPLPELMTRLSSDGPLFLDCIDSRKQHHPLLVIGVPDISLLDIHNNVRLLLVSRCGRNPPEEKINYLWSSPNSFSEDLFRLICNPNPLLCDFTLFDQNSTNTDPISQIKMHSTETPQIHYAHYLVEREDPSAGLWF